MKQALLKLNEEFFIRDVLQVAPELIGKYMVCGTGNREKAYLITETEAYRGEEDKACHASKGRTQRTEIMYHSGGHLYTYFIYGMYWMLNIVTGPEENPQAVLIRGIQGFAGPGILTRELGIDRSYYGEHLCRSDRIWLAKGNTAPDYQTTPRIGINYAGEPWISKPWRFVIKN